MASSLQQKSYSLALMIVLLNQKLQRDHNEYVLSRQLLRSGTAPGALLREAHFAASTADYINKFTIALKEANETKYWLRLLYHGKYVDENEFVKLEKLTSEVVALLVRSIKTLKEKAQNKEKCE